MPKILELRGCVRNNPWGSRSLLSQLFGFENPAGGPQAEYWMGVHPGGPGEVRVDGDWVPLNDWIRQAPEARLGAATVEKFGADLPFLFKILAAGEPLSLQAHPNEEQAKAGFALEDKTEVGIHDPTRSFRDSRAKPELLCALTPFDAMLGFRDLAEMHALILELDLTELNSRLTDLQSGTTEGLRKFFSSLLEEDTPTRARIAFEVARRCAELPSHPARRWVIELARRYPEDICVLAPLLLNVIRLEAGQAVFLPPGELHCYLEGCGVEIMSSSDNVLRCGLTRSHVDVPTLLDVLTFSHGDAQVLEPSPERNEERTYATPAKEFELSRVNVEGNHTSSPSGSIEILLFSLGAGEVVWGQGGEVLRVARGSSVVVSADSGAYQVRGSCSFFRATVPAS
jgi:mannose-6-phosphate isomerase